MLGGEDNGVRFTGVRNRQAIIAGSGGEDDNEIGNSEGVERE
jgi:hypothetical protein